MNREEQKRAQERERPKRARENVSFFFSLHLVIHHDFPMLFFFLFEFVCLFLSFVCTEFFLTADAHGGGGKGNLIGGGGEG